MATHSYGRYYCPNNHRCFPYDSYEAATVAPENGKKGAPVALFSLNGQRNGDIDGKWAYCFACGQWMICQRRDQYQIALMYLRRRGVKFRFEGRTLDEKAEALEEVMERRRASG